MGRGGEGIVLEEAVDLVWQIADEWMCFQPPVVKPVFGDGLLCVCVRARARAVK
jgi:hypothetical protein